MLRTLLPLLLALCALLVPPSSANAETSVVTAIRQSTADGEFRLEIDTAGAAEPALVLLHKPYRVALDFDDAVAAAKPPEPGPGTPVTAVRHGLVSAERYRITLTLDGPVRPALDVERRPGGSTARLTLAKGSEADFRVASPAAPRSTIAAASAPAADSRFTVVIDPGHGGIDRGAVGEGGTEEKVVNLAFGLALRDELAAMSGIEVVMTRDDDTFIPLNERSAIARRAGAELFVSLHADSIRYKDLRGATIYTLSEKASDSLASELADSENAADRFAGPEWDQDAPEIHDILVDLVRRETESFSERFALDLVTRLRDGGIQLINNPRRSAGFRVLRAPDVPSILLEIGYLSNPEEEEMLRSGEWQRKVADVLGTAIAEFAREHGAAIAATK